MIRCDECKFYVKVGDYGRCHRYPPKTYRDHIYMVGYQPLVDADDWCGEWKEKKGEG